MNDNANNKAIYAQVSPLKRISNLWLIPIITVLVGTWMIYDNWANQGPLITIDFASADGLEEGKTKIKARNVEVGRVQTITLKENLNGVTVTARMSNQVGKLLVDGTRFWVVSPQIGLSGASGLGTLLSGQYIEMSVGSGKEIQRHYEGLNKTPLTPPGTPGLHITLNTESDFSFSEGNAILFQGFKVGKIEDIHFNSAERAMYYNAFIQAPYHKLITTNTRFWNTSGVRLEVDTNGLSVQTGTLEAIVGGGISFGIPEGEPLGEPVTDRAYYYIYPSRKEIHEKQYVFSLDYVVLVDDSIAGLSVGAPVIYRGVPIGEVLRTDYLPEGSNLLDQSVKIPIYLQIYPGQLGLPDSKEGRDQAKASIDQLVTKGLTATIKSRNFLLGQQLVELAVAGNAVPSVVEYHLDVEVIPVGEDGISEMTDNIGDIVDKINALPIASMGANLDQLLVEASGTMAKMEQLASSMDKLANDAEQQKLMFTLNETLEQYRDLAMSFSSGSPANQDVQRALESIAAAMDELRPLLTELKNQPNGLIFTAREGQESQPVRKSN
ncbi:MAG: paraquat-inducible protein B [Pseudohongiellaceae bacterium]|jgi:paraquat-inducible protein B